MFWFGVWLAVDILLAIDKRNVEHWAAISIARVSVNNGAALVIKQHRVTLNADVKARSAWGIQLADACANLADARTLALADL